MPARRSFQRLSGSGIANIDTAVFYANEEAVGEGIRVSKAARDGLFVTTKVWYDKIAPGDLERSAEGSIRRLGLDHVDLLLIHWPNPNIPLRLSIEALNAVKKSGLTKHIGVSNFTLPLLAEAIRYSEAPLVCNQVEYHPFLDQSRMLAACRDAGMALTSYCPLFRGGDLSGEPAIVDAAQVHGKTAGQIVLRWHVQQTGVAAIPRTTKAARLAENIAIFDFSLTADEMAKITKLTRGNHRLCDFGFSPKWDAA